MIRFIAVAFALVVATSARRHVRRGVVTGGN